MGIVRRGYGNSETLVNTNKLCMRSVELELIMS